MGSSGSWNHTSLQGSRRGLGKEEFQDPTPAHRAGLVGEDVLHHLISTLNITQSLLAPHTLNKASVNSDQEEQSEASF